MTSGFSKKLENHEHEMALHCMYYNVCRKHSDAYEAAWRTRHDASDGRNGPRISLDDGGEIMGLREPRERKG